MRKPIIIITGIVVFIISGIIGMGELAGNASSTAPRHDSDFEKIENAIIIHGITTEEEPEEPNRPERQGKIVYDDRFSDSLEKKAVSQPKSTFMQEFDSMRRKDRSWHISEYTIKRGDNLWSIARKFKIDHRLIIKANDISNPNMLGPGKKVIVPNREGVKHTILRKDSLSSIAKAYGVSVQKIRQHNNIAGNTIRVGEVLFIPDAHPLKKKVEKITPQRMPVSVAKEPEERPRKTFLWPVEGRITSSFGKRISPISGKRSFHTGLDIGCSMDTPVKAAADGKVIFSGWKEIYGNMIIIKHDDGFITVYGHHKENIAKEDDEVKAGDVIARSGTSGASTGPHLHFEIRKHLTPLNPIRFLR